MSKVNMITSIIAACIGIGSMILIYYSVGWLGLIGIFLFVWSNNMTIISKMNENSKKQEISIKNILQKIFGEQEEDLDDSKLYHNSKVSDK